MRYLLVVVEGVTEKNLIETFLKTTIGQAPGRYGAIEVVPLSLDGNQGHAKLVEKAEECVDKYLNDPENCYEADNDEIEKWLVFDFDNLNERGLTLENIIAEAERNSFECIVSKPNIEFYILTILGGEELACVTKVSQYERKINELIEEKNKKEKEEQGGLGEPLNIPRYGKQEYLSRDCLWMIFVRFPAEVKKTYDLASEGKEKYSQMPRLLKRIEEITKEGEK